jgi:hypothetical protein
MHDALIIQHELFIQKIGMVGVGVIEGVAFFVLGFRVSRHGEASASARYAIAATGFAIAALVGLGALAPIIGYSLLCLSIACVYLADWLRDEHALKRRVALLSPRPAMDRMPMVWMAITLLLAGLTFVPYVIGGIAVVAAAISFGCAIAMVAVAWRLVSAPTQLTSENPQAEHICERADRARKAGLTCVVAIGTMFCFVSFANVANPSGAQIGHITFGELFFVWIALFVWQLLYVRQVSRSARAVST